MKKMVYIKGKEYYIPTTVGELPARRAMAIVKLLSEANKPGGDINEFNFSYVELVLGISKEEVDSFTFDEFIEIITAINNTFSNTEIAAPDEKKEL